MNFFALLISAMYGLINTFYNLVTVSYGLITVIYSAAGKALHKDAKDAMPPSEIAVPVSVNYHFTRKCNYSCGFCFHTAKTSYVLPLEVISL